jgi:hypothetical protein
MKPAIGTQFNSLDDAELFYTGWMRFWCSSRTEQKSWSFFRESKKLMELQYGRYFYCNKVGDRSSEDKTPKIEDTSKQKRNRFETESTLEAVMHG